MRQFCCREFEMDEIWDSYEPLAEFNGNVEHQMARQFKFHLNTREFPRAPVADAPGASTEKQKQLSVRSNLGEYRPLIVDTESCGSSLRYSWNVK